MKMQLHCIITGRVQGVMFRDFVQRKAQSLNIVGTVVNQPDGSVRVVAVGEKDKLEKLLNLLGKRPMLTRMISNIDDISTEWVIPTQDFSDFKIIY